MLRVGIIGTGLIAKEHAKAISMIPGSATLIAAADVVPKRLHEFCSASQVPLRYESAEGLIADPDVQLVAITTPPAAHESLTVTALDAGKYVLCEKPLAHSLASASRIATAANRHPGRLAVSHQMRYDPSFRRLIWLCRNKWIGEIQSVLVERHSYIPHTNHGAGGWWGSWKVAGGGVLMTQLIHEMDLLLQAIGRPLSVSAEMDTRYTNIESEDYVDATFQLAGGGTARCVASVNSGRFGGGITIHGSQGTVALPWKFTVKNPSRLSQALAELDRALPDTSPQSSSIVSRGSRFLARRLGVKAKPELTPHARLYAEIAQSIKSGTPLPIAPAEAMESLELCTAAYESALSGKEIGLPLSSTSVFYNGVSKEDYAARKCTRSTAKRTVIQIRSTEVIRVGIVGLDTSHAPTFTKILHDPYDPFHIPGAKVIAAYPGGSPDMQISSSRVEGFTNELRDKYGIRIVDAPEQVVEACDLVLILASDGRLHPGLFRSVAGRDKPVFIDKPFAISVHDAQDIVTVAAASRTPIFASSAFRYADALVIALNLIRETGEQVKTCRIRCWLPIQETQGRYFWYGIHAAEMLLATMGCGVCEVEASGDADQDRITVWHADGRKSSIVGSRGDGTFQVSIETDQRTLDVDLDSSMPSLSARLLWAALDVLVNKDFPRLWRATAAGTVSGNRPSRNLDPTPDETLEIVRLLDAAQRSYAIQQKIAV